MRKKLKKKITSIILMAAIAATSFRVADVNSSTIETNVVNAATTYNSKLEYTFKNLPINRVVQNFFIDTVNNRIYATMIRPEVNDHEDTLLIQCNITNSSNGLVATAKSFLLIKEGGHGTSLSGYYDNNNNLKLYIGCNNGKAISLIDASVLNKTGINNKNVNYYDATSKSWKTADGTEIAKSTPPLQDACYYTLSKKVTNFGKLCSGTKEEFDRADFVRASDGKAYIYVRYIKSNTKYLKIIRLSANSADATGLSDFDKAVAKQTTNIPVTDYVKATTYNAKMETSINVTGIKNLWQSEDVYMSSLKNRSFYLSTNTKTGDKLIIRRLPVGNISGYTYRVNGVTQKGQTVSEEEIEGIHREGKKIYFNHKVTYNKDTNAEKKVQTIESITIE